MISHEDMKQPKHGAKNQYLHRMDTKTGDGELTVHQYMEYLGHVGQSVLKNMSDKDPYRYFRKLRAGQTSRVVPLHASRGTKLLNEGGNVLEFDISGSGYQQFPHHYAHLAGRDNYYISENEQIERNNIRGKNRKPGFWSNYWQRKVNERGSLIHWIAKNTRMFKKWTRAYIEGENRLRERIQNEKIDVDKEYEKRFGVRTEGELRDKERILVKKKTVAVPGKQLDKTRITMSGPGMRNAGDYKIENLRNYMLTMGQEYLLPILTEWRRVDETVQKLRKAGKNKEADKLSATKRPVNLVFRGHSRGGAAAVQGAMLIKGWLSELFSEYEDLVKFELTQYDPVPGFGSRSGVNEEVNLRETTPAMLEKGMKALGDSAETTVVYSFHTQHDVFFTPQSVKGAKRVILTPFDHDVGLEKIDTSQSEFDGKEARRSAFTDAETGEVYRNTAINELGEGLYVVDETNQLIRIPDYQTARNILADITRRTAKGSQADRYRVIMGVVEEYFSRAQKPREAEPEKSGTYAARGDHAFSFNHLRERLMEADPWYIRSSMEFRRMKQSAKELRVFEESLRGNRLTDGQRKEYRRRVEELGKWADAYLSIKTGVPKNDREKKRIKAALEIKKYAAAKTDSLIRQSGSKNNRMQEHSATGKRQNRAPKQTADRDKSIMR